MDRQTEFIKLIDFSISTVQSLISQVQYQKYVYRYKKIIENLEDLKVTSKKVRLQQALFT